jgi:succinyl-CoA synthetase beta subunit
MTVGMRLHEYQAKRILSQFGVPVPRGQVATSVDEVCQIAAGLGTRVVLKAQVLIGGRGRAGGVRLANNVEEVEQIARQMFGMDIQGYVASKILVDEAIEIEQEIYLGIAIDRVERSASGPVGLGNGDVVRGVYQPVIVASSRGGIEIAEVTHDTPERVYRIPIDPLLGLRAYQVHELASDIGLGREQALRFVPAAMGLWQAFQYCDATLTEANPLVICPNGELMCLNARVMIDDNALFRHQDLADLRDESQESAAGRLARRHGIHYVRLGGHVGCLSNGAGLAMATMDLLRLNGIRAASFVDIGVGAQAPKVAIGLRLALGNSIEAVLINVFGGATCCDEIARGILTAYQELEPGVPLIVRLEGTNQQLGREILSDACARHPGMDIQLADSVQDAVSRVAAKVQER